MKLKNSPRFMASMLMLLLALAACGEQKIAERNIDKVPLCSTGRKVELDVEYLKHNHPIEYAKLPWQVRILGFRPMICKSG